MSRLRDEAIKAAEDKKEEEKKREEEEREKKPGKDGIRVRLQMLQNRLTVQKTSDSVKQLMFERDLELEMLRRKKHYQTSASGWISSPLKCYFSCEGTNLQQDCFLIDSFVAGY